jgi:hypothetical protein
MGGISTDGVPPFDRVPALGRRIGSDSTLKYQNAVGLKAARYLLEQGLLIGLVVDRGKKENQIKLLIREIPPSGIYKMALGAPLFCGLYHIGVVVNADNSRGPLSCRLYAKKTFITANVEHR